MADEIDLACEQEEKYREAALAAHKPVPMDPGKPGDCDLCGDYFTRLVGGACGFCRDKYKLP